MERTDPEREIPLPTERLSTLGVLMMEGGNSLSRSRSRGWSTYMTLERTGETSLKQGRPFTGGGRVLVVDQELGSGKGRHGGCTLEGSLKSWDGNCRPVGGPGKLRQPGGVYGDTNGRILGNPWETGGHCR